ncbi:DUF397 domain-containing protein [Streptomyces sp. GKU 257-1]|nr:DUF397 domain-containing protein [Streptomyces sp. GKU 257-1]
MTTTGPTPCPAEFKAAAWTKSSYSAPNNECVETAAVRDWALIRDSKTEGGPVLAFAPGAYAAFLDHVKTTHSPA